jgi:putative CocE/NonD family hydrolase
MVIRRQQLTRILHIVTVFAVCGICHADTGKVLQQVMIPMRDGTKLAADVYLPKGEGPFPVVVARSVYGRGDNKFAQPFTSQGIAFVPQDTRGRGDSEGRDRVFADDGWMLMQDGFDTISWIRRQTWCNGKVGTWGGSALGITQIWLAAAGAEVDFQSIGVASATFYGEMTYQGGVWRRALCEPWLKNQQRENVIELWKSHPYLDAFWQSMDSRPRAAHVNAPALHVGGWWDIFQQGTINNFVQRQEHGGAGAVGTQKLIMGPWAHGTHHGPQKLGDLNLPENYKFDVENLERRLYRHYLLGEQNQAERVPAVHYYTLGDVDDVEGPGNEWRTADSWPPFETVNQSYYLSPGRRLTTELPDDGKEFLEFIYDPQHPCPTHGGANLSLPSGPFDQRKVSQRADVLNFTTEPLDKPLEVTGRVSVRLFVSSDAPDTDFTAKLVDIYPDGREILLLDSIQRVKLRRSLASPSCLAPGTVGQVDIDLWSISIVFAAGHRIGLQISSSNYPRFEKNPNTGEDFPSDDNLRVTKNRVYTGPHHSSVLILPVRE